eukprot:g5233.t1
MNQTITERRIVCPSCHAKGKRVGVTTIRSLLKPGVSDQLNASPGGDCCAGDVGCGTPSDDTGWRFCDSTDCDVVYFSETTGRQFGRSDLTVAVGVKETSGDRPLCYCFGHSVASIKDEFTSKGRCDALEDIRSRMKDPGCFCETSNPSGSCCLGSVTKGINIAQEELKMSAADIQSPPASVKSSTGKGETIAKAGTLVSAVLASACCWLPLVLLAVGVSGAGIAATLEAYRPLFMVVTVGFLGAAFYFTYRPKKTVANAGGDCCATEPAAGDDCCAPAGKRRFKLQTMNKVMLWVVTVLAVAFLAFPSYVGALFADNAAAVVTPDMKQAVFKIDGMTCEGCSVTVAKAISGVAGVDGVEVSYENREALDADTFAKYLKTSQGDDGSWTTPRSPGISALVTAALMRSGVPPTDATVARALKHLSGFVRKDGGIYSKRSGHRNYETCISLLAFHAANKNGEYDKTIANADKFLRKLQWDEEDGKKSSDESYGGAGYGRSRRPDLSNTAFLVEALKAAGAKADDPALKKALKFVSRCQNLETEHNTTRFSTKVNDGGFYYTPAGGGSSPAGKETNGGLRSYGTMTYAGLKSMIHAGLKPDDPRVKGAFRWVRQSYSVERNPGVGQNGVYYYYHTFAKTLGVLNLDHVKDAKGHQHDWRKELAEALVKRQKKNGSWVNSSPRWFEGDPNLATAYALTALSYCDPRPVSKATKAAEK